ADLVESPSVDWYGVFLEIRPNEKNRVNAGRETFILPVDWSGEWPIFEGGMEPLKPFIAMPPATENKMNSGAFFPNGNFTFVDKFEGNGWGDRWISLRGPREQCVAEGTHGVVIQQCGVNL